MVRMSMGGVKVAVDKQGIVTIPEAEGVVVGKVLQDPQKRTRCVAAVAAEDGKLGRKTSEHPSRQAAFRAILEARGLVQAEES